MSERFTKKDAERAAARLCRLFNRQPGHYMTLSEGQAPLPGAWVSDNGRFASIPGGWELDYNAIYGGYVLEQIDDQGGTGVSRPFGDERRSARDFWRMVNDIERALYLAEQLRQRDPEGSLI